MKMKKKSFPLCHFEAIVRKVGKSVRVLNFQLDYQIESSKKRTKKGLNGLDRDKNIIPMIL